MKKILSIVGVLSSVIAPIGAVISCGSATNKIDPKEEGPNKTNQNGEVNLGIHVLAKKLEMDTLATGKRAKEVNCWHVTLDQEHINKAKEIREYMNKSDDKQWHTYGDSMLDGINAIRFAIHESLNGNQTLKHLIRDFADNGGAISNPGNGSETDNRKANVKDNAFKKMAKKHINDWFDSDKNLIIINDIPGWGNIEKIDADKKSQDSKYNKFIDENRYLLFESNNSPNNIETLSKKYGALTLGTPELLTAQHRVQEIDWLGEFDGHDHGKTMSLIKAKAKEYNHHPTGELSKAPTGDEGFKSEDYMFPFTYNDHKFEEGADFVSGLLTAINVLYDTDDGSATTGHRTNFYSEKLTTFGWSRHANNRDNFQYILTESGKEKLPGRTATKEELAAHKGIQLIYDNPVSSEDLEKIVKANPFLNKYSIDALKYLSPMNFLNKINVNKDFVNNNYAYFIADNGGAKMVAELYKQHSSLLELEAELLKPTSAYGDNIDLKQPTTEEEYPRFAKQQIEGQKDMWIKTYDYNGGSTITGEQYGTTPINKALFEN